MCTIPNTTDLAEANIAFFIQNLVYLMLYHTPAFNAPSSPAYLTLLEVRALAKDILALLPFFSSASRAALHSTFCDRVRVPTLQLGLGSKTEIFPSHIPAICLRFNRIMKSGNIRDPVWGSMSWMIQMISAPRLCALGAICTQAHPDVQNRERQKGYFIPDYIASAIYPASWLHSKTQIQEGSHLVRKLSYSLPVAAAESAGTGSGGGHRQGRPHFFPGRSSESPTPSEPPPRGLSRPGPGREATHRLPFCPD